MFSKSTFLKKIRLQEATWAEVEPKWSPRGSQDGAQEGAKTSPRGSQDGAKNEKKNEVNLGRVSVSLGGVKVSPGFCYEAAGGVRGDKRLQEADKRPPGGLRLLDLVLPLEK